MTWPSTDTLTLTTSHWRAANELGVLHWAPRASFGARTPPGNDVRQLPAAHPVAGDHPLPGRNVRGWLKGDELADFHWALTLEIFCLGFCWEFGISYWDKYGILSEIALFSMIFLEILRATMIMGFSESGWFHFHLPIGLTQELCYCRAGFKSPINHCNPPILYHNHLSIGINML